MAGRKHLEHWLNAAIFAGMFDPSGVTARVTQTRGEKVGIGCTDSRNHVDLGHFPDATRPVPPPSGETRQPSDGFFLPQR